MTTPIQTFHAVASRYGQVDPGDARAVREWYTEVLPTLPRETIEEILEELLSADGTVGAGETARAYPQNVPIPLLSSSPLIRAPFFSGGWRRYLRRLF